MTSRRPGESEVEQHRFDDAAQPTSLDLGRVNLLAPQGDQLDVTRSDSCLEISRCTRRLFARTSSFGRGRLYSSVRPTQSIELARSKTFDGAHRCASTPRASIVISLPEESCPPGHLSSDRFRFRTTDRRSVDLDAISGTPSRREIPSPLSSSLSCSAPPVRTGHHSPTALRGRGSAPADSYLRHSSRTWRLKYLADHGQAPGNYPGSHVPYPVRNDLQRMRRVA